MSRISDALAASMIAHLNARRLRKEKKFTEAQAALDQAHVLRKRAHGADPDHRDPAWREMTVSSAPVKNREVTYKTQGEIHADMMAFYKDQGCE